MAYINFNNYSDYVNPFIYTLPRVIKESHESERFVFRYEDALSEAINSNKNFKELYFKFLLGNNFNSNMLYHYSQIKARYFNSYDKAKFKKKFTIREILNDNWDNYVERMKNKCIIPEYVFDEVEKVRICRTKHLGFDIHSCPKCGEFIFNFHTCKSRFCSSCGVKYAKARSIEIQKKALKCKHRHIVFTIPEELRHFFKKDKSLLNVLFDCASDVINYLFNDKREKNRKDKSKAYSIIPGFISVLHTFGRDLKWNPHIHMLISEGGHNSKTNSFSSFTHFNYNLLRNSWQYCVLSKLSEKLGRSFYPLKTKLYKDKDNGFYVYAPKTQFDDNKKAIDYIVRYTGRPVMSESRIKDYDGEFVTWEYHPHEDESKLITVKDKAFDFISKIIQHIPVKHFKTVRYYGLYSAKNHKHRGIKENMYSDKEIKTATSLIKYRNSIIFNYYYDPFRCRKCESNMILECRISFYRKDGLIHEKTQFFTNDLDQRKRIINKATPILYN